MLLRFYEHMALNHRRTVAPQVVSGNNGGITFIPPLPQQAISPTSALNYMFTDIGQTQDQRSLFRILLPVGLLFGQSAVSQSQSWWVSSSFAARADSHRARPSVQVHCVGQLQHCVYFKF